MGEFFIKKVTYSVIVTVLICISYLLIYFSQYHIKNDHISIESNVKKWLQFTPTVLQTVQLNNSNSYIVLFKSENSTIGYAQLLKGWNGKFRIERSGYGTNMISYEAIETNEGVYGILVGKNPDLKIDHISVKLVNGRFSFSANVSKDENFVKYQQLPSDIAHIFPAELTYFDIQNNQIQLSELNERSY